MRTRLLVVASTLAVAGLTPHIAQGQSFQWIRPHQNYPSPAYSTGIRRDGSAIIGNSCCSAHNSNGIGFLWTSQGISDTTFSWNGYSYTAIGNSANAIAGQITYWPDYTRRALGSNALLPGAPASGESTSTAVSDDGTVYAGDSTTAAGPHHAFRWTQATGMVDLGTLPGGTSSWVTGMSGNGWVIIGTSDSPSGTFPFRWTAETGMVSLGHAPDGAIPHALNITANGTTIYLFTVGALPTLYRWTPTSGYQPFFSSPIPLIPSFVSDDGTVIVGSANGVPSFWRQDLGVVGLKAYLQAHGWVFLPGDNEYPSGIAGVSANGRVMTGGGYNAGANLPWVAYIGAPAVPPCSADFDCDGHIGTDADIESFFACLAGACPAAPCRSTADFNHDGDAGTDADIESFFRVLAGGTC